MGSSSDSGNSPAQAAPARLPRHIAVIMDGNNRWAKRRNNSNHSGHRAGAITARSIINLCADKDIEYLTLFVFSSENWLRPKKEVNSLMALFLNVLQRQEVAKLHERNIRISFIGDRSKFSDKLQELMRRAEDITANNTGLNVIVAANYGGRWDIANAARLIAEKVAAGAFDPSGIDESTIQEHIAAGDLPPPDLCIRTGGEQRISNFLLWQFAYTEFYFTDVLWPDFGEDELDAALKDFARRQRRFGMASEQVE